MDFLSGMGGGGEGVAPRVQAAVAALRAAAMDSERQDALEALRGEIKKTKGTDRSGQAKRAVGQNIKTLLGMLEEPELDEDLGQGIIEIIRGACEEDEAALAAQQHSLDTTSGPGTISGTGGVSFEWLQAPLDNTDAILRDAAQFETVVQLLVLPRFWIRLSTVQLLMTCIRNRPELTEKALEATPAGMERLVDVLDDENDEIRHKMLLVLRRLTENNEQLQNFLAFRDGFSKLFQIIEKELREQSDMVAQDCLVVMNNCLNGNALTQKLFVQSNHLSKLPIVLDLPRVRPRGGSGEAGNDTGLLGSPRSVADVDAECGPPRMHILSEALELVSNLVSGLCPAEVLDRPWFDPDDELVPARSHPGGAISASVQEVADPAAAEELARRRTQQRRDMQTQVGNSDKLLQAIAELALCLPAGDADDAALVHRDSADTDESHEEDKITWASLRQDAFFLLGDLACGNEAVASNISRLEVVAPSNSALAHLTWRTLALHSAAGDKAAVPVRPAHGSVRSALVCGAAQAAVLAPTPEERTAASYFWECLLHEHPGVQIGIIGHAITPPPEDVYDHEFMSRIAPPSGRLLLDMLCWVSEIAMAYDSTRCEDDGRGDQDDLYADLDVDDAHGAADVFPSLRDAAWLKEAHLRCGRMVESLLRGNVAGMELAMRIPVAARDAGFRSSVAVTDPGVATVDSAGAGAGIVLEQDHGTGEGEGEGESEVFGPFLRDVAKALRQYFADRTQVPGKTVAVSLLRVLFAWLEGSGAVARALLASSSSLILFDVASGKAAPDMATDDPELEGLTSLCLGLCLCSLTSGARSQASSAKKGMGPDEILRLISSRIGFEQFSDRIARLERVQALKVAAMSRRAREQLAREGGAGSDLAFFGVRAYDARFVAAYGRARDRVQQAIIELYTQGEDEVDDGAQDLEPDVLREKYKSLFQVGEQYKNLIRWQDTQIKSLERTIKAGNLPASQDSEGSAGQLIDQEKVEGMQRQIDNLVQDKHDLEQASNALRQQLHDQGSELAAVRAELEAAQRIAPQPTQASAHVALDMSGGERTPPAPQPPQDQSGLVEELQRQLQDAQSQLWEAEERLADSGPGTAEAPVAMHGLQPRHAPADPSRDAAATCFRGLLDAARASGAPGVARVLPDLAATMLARATHGELLREAAALANSAGEYAAAATLLEQVGGDEALAEARAARERMGGMPSEQTPQEEVAELRAEHAQLVLLLANQEMDKHMLLDKIKHVGGEEAWREARTLTPLRR